MINSSGDEKYICAHNLEVHRGKVDVLHGLNFNIQAGSITGLLGPSGCGKTTLMRTIIGSQKIHSGSMTINGLPAGHPTLRQLIGYTSQGMSIYTDISVGDNVRYFAGLKGDSPHHAAEIIDRVGLGEYADRRITQLSGGQANRASLACALVGQPKLLVLDEPTVGLDPLTRQSLWELFHELADEGATLIISSHVLDEATKCDRVIFMREGHILAHKSASELMSDTQTTTPEDAFLAMIEEQK